jgi:hypothetical protein
VVSRGCTVFLLRPHQAVSYRNHALYGQSIRHDFATKIANMHSQRSGTETLSSRPDMLTQKHRRAQFARTGEPIRSE